MTFGERLRQLRNQASMTVPALADKAGLQMVSVYNYEAGRLAPSFRAAAQLAKALGVSADEFLDCELPVDLRLENRRR